LLKQAGARLTKPKLLAAYGLWRKDWSSETAALGMMSLEEKMAFEATKRVEAEAEASKLRKELDAARKAMLDGTGREAEMQRMAEAELEKEKEKRVEHLKSVAIRRIALKDLARGWMGWHGMWSEKVRQRNLLKQAGSRMTKPKLVAGFSHWFKDWMLEAGSKYATAEAKLRGAQQQVADVEAELHRVKIDGDRRLTQVTKERDAALAKLSGFDGGLTERELTLQRKLEDERLKRIEQVGAMAANRFGKGQLGRGWTTWHAAWRERCEQKRLLRQLAGRLMKPKLGYSYGFWRHSWEAERLAVAEDRSAANWTSKSAAAEAERSKLQLELAEARAAILEGTGQEAELRRLAEEEVAAQKEQRVAQLGRMAARRLGHRDLSRGWTAWYDLAAVGRYQRSMLRSVASRLAKPKLSRAYVHWRQDWDRMEAAKAAKAQLEKIRGQQASHDDAEYELQRQVSALEEELKMNKAALVDQREAALKHAQEIAAAMRESGSDKESLQAARKALEATQEEARQAKELLSRRQEKDSDEGAKKLSRMLEEQRDSLEKQARVVQKGLEDEIRTLSNKVTLLEGRSKSTRDREGLIEYDPSKTVIETLKEYLAFNQVRVLDLFREFDTDGSGRVDKPEWRAAWKTIGPNFPTNVVDDAFDIFDPDKSGSIEFGELDKLLRRKASDMWATLKRKNGATSPPADQTDAEGLGRGEFKSNMQIKADDFYEADQDGNTELEYDEFCAMLRKRDAKAEPPVERSESDLKALFRQLDLDNSGTVDLSEYIQWALAIAIKESKGRVLDLFREWDSDNSGFIDCSEFSQALNGMGFTCKKPDAKKIFEALDPDGSGQLDYREVNAALRRIQRRAYTSFDTGDKKITSSAPGGARKPTASKPAGRKASPRINQVIAQTKKPASPSRK